MAHYANKKTFHNRTRIWVLCERPRWDIKRKRKIERERGKRLFLFLLLFLYFRKTPCPGTSGKVILSPSSVHPPSNTVSWINIGVSRSVSSKAPVPAARWAEKF